MTRGTENRIPLILLTLLSSTANAQNIQGSYQPKADGQVTSHTVSLQ